MTIPSHSESLVLNLKLISEWLDSDSAYIKEFVNKNEQYFYLRLHVTKNTNFNISKGSCIVFKMFGKKNVYGLRDFYSGEYIQNRFLINPENISSLNFVGISENIGGYDSWLTTYDYPISSTIDSGIACMMTNTSLFVDLF